MHISELWDTGISMSHETKQNDEENAAQLDQQSKTLIVKTLTAQLTLEYFMSMGMVTIIATVLWSAESSSLFIRFIQGSLLVLVVGLVAIAIWGVILTFKNAKKYCKEGKFEEKLAELNQSKPYTFYKTGEHLVHVVCSGIVLLGVFVTELEMTTAQRIILFASSLITCLMTMAAMYVAVGKANRYKAEQANKSK